MLNQYINQTQQLLQNPQAPATLYSSVNIISWINTARGQIAGEGHCIRALGTISTVPLMENYGLSDIGFGSGVGLQGALTLRRIQVQLSQGHKWVRGKSWEWYDLYRYNNPAETTGFPTEWALFAPGANGQFFIAPPPDLIYILGCDCDCYPINLASDTDIEALPYPWTDAVPYFAAYLALMSAQTNARMQQAQQLFQLYEMFMNRARNFATPDVTPFNFEQSPDPSMRGRFGGAPGGVGGGGGQAGGGGA